jgi:GH15 family glucan-1,4-alpha-glucosidase
LDLAIIGNGRTAALVDPLARLVWWCYPRFNSDPVFSRLLAGDQEKGFCDVVLADRASFTSDYIRNTAIVRTILTDRDGASISVTDFAPRFRKYDRIYRPPQLVRIIEPIAGRPRITIRLRPTYNYGVPVETRQQGSNHISYHGKDSWIRLTTDASISYIEEETSFVLTRPISMVLGPDEPVQGDIFTVCREAMERTRDYWMEWVRRLSLSYDWQEAIIRAAIALKLSNFEETGGIVAALTSSIPEAPHSGRTWDYRYCWLRDATFTLFALTRAGFVEEARSWRGWLLRAIAGSPAQMQILYGMHGERRLPEFEIEWLAGYENSRPVRVGNAASNQFQLDVYGEVMSSMYHAQQAGIKIEEPDWAMQRALMKFLESHWQEPDEGIWEVRGGRKNFTHSKMMAWLAFHRGVQLIEEAGLPANDELERWKKVRDQIHREVCERGYNPKVKAFTQYYGSDALDASLLMMPMVGFLPIEDERVRNTIAAIERDLLVQGFVLRYRPEEKNVDGLPGDEGVFLPCSFWLAICLNLLGRKEEAHELFERLLTLQNDLGLISEEYDPRDKRLLGNFPQAFTHVSLIVAAQFLEEKK